LFVRDSELVYALLGLNSLDAVLRHTVAGSSWEGIVVEQLIIETLTAQSRFYRTSNGAEVALVLEFRGRQTWINEIKRSSAPTVLNVFTRPRPTLALCTSCWLLRSNSLIP
jgi:hypothetical protein